MVLCKLFGEEISISKKTALLKLLLTSKGIWNFWKAYYEYQTFTFLRFLMCHPKSSFGLNWKWNKLYGWCHFKIEFILNYEINMCKSKPFIDIKWHRGPSKT